MAYRAQAIERFDTSPLRAAGQTNLKYLDLYHTRLSEQGFNSVKKALPNANINWSLDASRVRRRT